MEDQGEQSRQTFLVKNFCFFQPPRKHEDWHSFKGVLNTDHGLKAASWT